MASITPSDDQTLIRKPVMIQRRRLMLKDYLRDDFLSSCSSNGFKSFPRRQCCTTVRFLLELDLKARGSPTTAARNGIVYSVEAVLEGGCLHYLLSLA
ncbi:hypothetical protein SLA2020_281270 [Shorea laevis]